MKKIGIFGGSFNPPHNGHINIVRKITDFYGFDKVFIIPSSIPPHKRIIGDVTPIERYEMCKLAFNDSDFFVSDIEMQRQGKSYTYDTLLELKNSNNGELNLIIGSDMLLCFEEWYRYEDILSMAKIIVSARIASKKEASLIKYKANKLNRLYPGAVTIFYTVPFEISSTQIREMLRNNEDISRFVPELVCEYIYRRGLYGGKEATGI
ncbi:MAG TPA: nicotinate (nicotinamide) nucleotide adenylyltransferase [Clostridia bacterium]|nr:nicotinate (nicotinamide) nucleotide adenylyltransferase [Clostridia bacterium]